MSPGRRSRLLERLAAWAPASLLVVGDASGDLLPTGRVTRLEAPGALEALQSLGRFDAAVVVPPASEVAADEFELVLGRLKNFHAPRILVEADPAGELPARLRALAFEPDEAEPALWVHDIDRYNPRREWNTAEDWANPENFDKYRW